MTESTEIQVDVPNQGGAPPDIERDLLAAQEFEDKYKQGQSDLPGDADPNSSSSQPPETSEDEDSTLSAVRLRHAQAKAQNREQNLRLRKVLAYCAIGLVGVQLLTSNLYFAYFLAHNITSPDPKIMIAWLSASVIEVIGILLVIARSLFPVKSKPKDDA